MSLWRSGIIFDGPDGLAVSVSGMRGGKVTSIQPLQVGGHSPEELADQLRTAVRQHGIRGQIRAILPAAICENHVRQHTVPLPDEAVAGDAIRFLEDECGLEPHAYDVHTNAYVNDDGRQSVVISVMERGTMARFRNAFESAGLHDVVLISPVDAMVLLHESFVATVTAKPRALVHVGRTHTLMLVIEGELPAFFRSITRNLDTRGSDLPHGEADLSPELALTDEAMEGLAGELIRTVQYYKQLGGADREVGQIVLTATNLDLRLLASTLAQRTETPCLPATASDVTSGTPDTDMAGALAEIGMALPVAIAGPRKVPVQMQLVSTPSHRAELFTSRRTWTAVVVLYVLVLAVYWAMLVMQTHDLSAEITRLEGEEQKIAQLIARRQQQHASRQSYVGNALWLLRMKQQGVLASDMLVAVNNLRPEEVKFGNVQLDADNKTFTLRIKGHVPKLSTAEALRKLDDFAASLRKTALFTDTRIEKPVLDGPGGADLTPQEQQQRKLEGIEPNAVNYTLVVQSSTPWSEGVKGQ